MTLKLHISSHNDNLHNTTAKRNLAGGVAGLNSSGLIDNDRISFHSLTETDFRTNPGTGTATDPDNLNDNNTSTVAYYANVAWYVQIDFTGYALIKEYRQYGHGFSVGAGKMKIQHLWGNTWVDNTIDIPIRNASWSNWALLTIPVFTKGIRFIPTVLDPSAGKNEIGQLEIRG